MTTLDRVMAMLTGVSLLCVFLLSSQSGASFPTYVLALLALVAGGDRWRVFVDSRIVAGLLVALLIYFSSSVWWSTDHPLRAVFSIYSRCLLIVAFVLAFSVSLSRVPGFVQWLSRCMAVAGGTAALAALIDFQLHPTWDGRLVGLGQLHNSVVAALSFDAALLFALSCAIAEVAWWRAIGGACAAVLGLAVFATGSRNGYLAAAVGIWALAVTCWRPAAPRRLLWLAVPMLGLGTIGAALLMARPELLATVFPRGDSFRLEIWRAEWDRLVADGPWLGLGILARDDVGIAGEDFSHPHSLYLASALQGGLVGLLLLLSVLACAGSKLLYAVHLREARLGLALLATGVSAYLFDGWELIDKVGLSWLLLWVPVAIAIGVTSKMGNTGGIAGSVPAESSSDSSVVRP